MFWRNKRKIDFSWVSSDSRFSDKITLRLVFGLIFFCFFVASVLLVVVVSVFANGVPVVWWLLFRMMLSWYTFSLSLSCVFIVCPGLFLGVTSLRCCISQSTGGLLTCQSPLRWVMLALLSSCPLCYLFVPFVPLCWGGVRFLGEFGVLVHSRLRWNRLWRISRDVWWLLHSPYWGEWHSSQTQKKPYALEFKKV